MGRPVVIAEHGRPVTVAFNGIGEPLTIADNGYGEPVRVVNAWGQPVVIEDGDALALGADLLAWWDASYGITVTGAGVSAWVDRKSGHTLVQATDGARPAYSATGFNGAPGVTFDGTADYLSMESVPFPSGADPSEIWIVVQQDTDPVAVATTRGIVSYGAAGTVNRAVARNPVLGVNRAYIIAGTGSGSPTATVEDVDFSSRHLVRGVFDTTSSVAVDGGTPVTVASALATATTRVRVGSNMADTPTTFWTGVLRDIIVTTPLSAEKAAFLETFLLGRRML